MLDTVITAKDLMLMPNIPRFVREQDNLIFSAKIDNMLEETVKGAANIKFFDALSMKDITNEILQNDASKKNFEIAKLGNTQVSWNVKIPLGLSGIVYRITAETENHSDGEEQIIPVLPNRMLVTESMPMAIRGVQSKNFNFTRFLNSHKSSSLSHHKLNLEFTANPAWYAVQALPYLIENPNECAEQVFSRFYANSLASHIANSDKKIRHVFNLWRDLPDSEALISNLEKNQDLKAVMLEETPWVMQAQNETERKRRIGLLFDVSRMSNQTNAAINKLEQMQISSGGWPWFEGMPEDIYISQYILAGMGQLNKIGVVDIENNPQLQNIVKNAIKFVDAKLVKEYKELKDLYKKMKLDMDTYSPSYLVIQYLYARSFFIETHPISKNTKEAFDFYYGQSEKFWLHKSYYMKGMLALNFKRYGNEKLANDVIKSLEEFSLQSEEMGMFWKLKSGWFWYELPIETQAILIEAFDEVANDQESVEEMQIWLLKQKQTQDWKTSTATANAIYALLLKGTDLLATENLVKIQIGNENINLADNKLFKTEPGTGYFQKAWTSSEIKPNMGNVKVEKQNKGIAWGALYWQYFEDIDKIAKSDASLDVEKALFVEQTGASGKELVPINGNRPLQVGDKVVVRLTVRTDRDIEFVHLKDLRAACFE
ncbi:MAG: hypothetical protein GX879_04925, partial [Bacteroidales bacterium]|nr:hypothetical protein [Bacteroidales bacterium]